MLTVWVALIATPDSCRNKITEPRDISTGTSVPFGRLLSLKHHICGLRWQRSPGVTRSLIQTRQCDTGWRCVGTNLRWGGLGGLAAVIWAEFKFGQKPLSRDSLTSFITFSSPPSSRCAVRRSRIKQIFTHTTTCSAHKRSLAEQRSTYH